MSDLLLKNILRGLFVSRYSEFKRYLHRRLGSEDLASDALHETYLRVESMNTPSTIKYPSAYLYRMALNVAEDQRKIRGKMLSTDEIEGLYDMADELADPGKIMEAKSDIRALERAMEDMPKRRRAILLASRIDHMANKDIAVMFNVSTRTVEKELRAALEHCCEKLGKEYVQRFGPKADKENQDGDA